MNKKYGTKIVKIIVQLIKIRVNVYKSLDNNKSAVGTSVSKHSLL